MFSIHRVSCLPNLSSSQKCLLRSRIHGISGSVVSDPTRTTVRFSQQKAGKRGGQNLTNRDVRLSKSIRQKQALSRVGLPEDHASDPSSFRDESFAQREIMEPLPSKSPGKMFQGMTVPERPRPPESDECCMSGCAVCVYDLYLTSLETYREAVTTMRSTLQDQNVPISQWPEEIRPDEGDDPNGQNTPSELDVSMSAFAELEKTLRREKSP